MNSSRITVILLLIMLISGCAPGKRSNVKNIHSATGTTLVCFGDSLTAGKGAPLGSDYPSILAERLSLTVINAGISGDTAAQAINRLERDVLKHNPKIVIVELGANDLLRSGGSYTAIDETFSDLEAIIDEIQENGAVVVLAGIYVNYYISEKYKSLAKRKGAVLVPDIMDGILNDPKLMSDTIHPNAAGYEIMAEKFIEVLEPLLRQMD